MGNGYFRHYRISRSHSTKTPLLLPLLPLRFSYSSTQLPHSLYLHSLQQSYSFLLVTGRKPDAPFTAKLLDAYCKSGRIADAEKLFDQMPNKNVVLWSTMIYGYARNGFYMESLKLFLSMQVLGITPNSFTLVAVLVGAAGLRSLTLSGAVHGRILKSGLDSNSFLRTAMLDTYAKCESIADSCKLFEQMGEVGLTASNAMIAGFIRNQLFEEVLLLFNEIRMFGLLPNAVTMLSVIPGCRALASAGLCKCVHGYVVKIGLNSNISILNSVLDMYLSLENLDNAAELFQSMDFKDVVSWTMMMGALVHYGCASDTLKLSCQMRDAGINPDTVATVHVVTACGLLGDLAAGLSVHGWIVTMGFSSVLPVLNSLIGMYSKSGDLESARTIFDSILQKSLISWTVMISGYTQNGQPRKALGLFLTMRTRENFRLDLVTLLSVMAACGEIAALDLCKQLHAHAFAAGFLQCKSIQNSLVITYSRCGDVELAHSAFQEMPCPDIVSWNAIIGGCGINSNGEAAVFLFQEMVKSGKEPDAVTYLSVLHACDHSGLVEKGLEIFHCLVNEKKVEPTGEHFGCLVDMLARAGHFEEANEFIRKAKLGLNCWRALLGGCWIHDNVRIAEQITDRLFQLEPKDSGDIVLLSNLYASFGKFGKAESLRLRMKQKKNTGLSMLDLTSHDTG